jgi:hypothetical protein
VAQPIETILLQHDDPAVRYKLRRGLEGETRATRRLQQEIRRSQRVAQLLSDRMSDGRLPHHPYVKWVGAHWTLAVLADLGYPPGDRDLMPLVDQVYEWLDSPRHARTIKTINGRVRRCASQEANLLHSVLRLGLADERAESLAQRLLLWQWPDGGWNCDRRPQAVHSSFMESLIPMRALHLYGHMAGDRAATGGARQAGEIFLKRDLYRQRSTGKVIDPDFLRLHYPCYWHYDILFGLKVMHECGLLDDERCAGAVSILAGKRLADGGFPAEGKYYRLGSRPVSQSSLVDWGGVNRRRHNPFVSAEALTVLKAARWSD